jgi:LDH2 family malate/lactate/ureidoglycolate dehydrogenase
MRAVPDVVVPAARVAEQVATVLRAWGMREEQLQAAVPMIVYADLAGIDSHGIGMFPTYHAWRGKGWINMQPQIRIEREGPTTALIDGDGSLGHVPARMAMELAIEKCRKLGIGAVAVRNSTHFGAAGAYAALASEAGVLGIATTSAVSLAIVPTFGCEPMFGTNPLAFAAPAGRHPAFLLDMATSTVAIGKVTLAVHRGERLPPGWAVDEHGRPLRDARRASRLHWLTPLGGEKTTGGHKGYGLAAMVEILSAILPGSAARWTRQQSTDSPMPRVGHFLLALDPAMYRAPGEFTADMDAMIDALHACKQSAPGREVLVAGEPEHLSVAARRRQGIPLSRSLVGQLRKVAEAAGVPFVLDTNAAG